MTKAKKIFLIISALTLFSSLTYSNEMVFDEKEAYDFISISSEAQIKKGIKEAKKNVATIFNYNENDSYRVYCRANNLTTIFLQPGEQVLGLDGGDTSRWNVKSTQTGSSQGPVEIIQVKPQYFQPGNLLKTNLTITTNRRFYNIELVSCREWYNPIIKFNYPSDIIREKIFKSQNEEEMTLVNPEKLNYKYSISTKRYAFAPTQIYDDGKKTIMVLRGEIQETPVFHIKEGDKLLMVNYRIKGNYLIVDRTFDKGVLSVGNKKVYIKNKAQYR